MKLKGAVTDLFDSQRVSNLAVHADTLKSDIRRILHRDPFVRGDGDILQGDVADRILRKSLDENGLTGATAEKIMNSDIAEGGRIL